MPAKIISPYNFTLDRGNREPLDATSVFSSLSDLENYLSTGTRYAGQFVAIYDTTDTSYNGPYYIDCISNEFVAIPLNTTNSVWLSVNEYHNLEISGHVDPNTEYNLYEPNLKIYTCVGNIETEINNFVFNVITPEQKGAYMKISFINPSFTINQNLFLYTNDDINTRINANLVPLANWGSQTGPTPNDWAFDDTTNTIYINMPEIEKIGIKLS